MRWELPESSPGVWKKFLSVWLIAAIMLFLATSMGHGNSSIPKFWGDPIPFSDALAKAPRICAAVLLGMLLYLGLTGIRSGD